MHILLIGGTRFVGYQLTWRLLAADHHVTLLNRGHTPDPFGQRARRLIADRTTPDFERVLTGQSLSSPSHAPCQLYSAASGACAGGTAQLGGGVWREEARVPQPYLESQAALRRRRNRT